MPDLLNIGTTGLLTYQRALSTTSHNIANVNTDGFSRQRSEIQANSPTFKGDLIFGNGSRVASISRAYDNLLTRELRDNQASFSRAEVFSQLASTIDDVLADPQGGLSPQIIEFFAAVQDVAEDPASTTARNTMIDIADVLTNRLTNFDLRFQNIEENTTQQIRDVVGEINSLVEGIRDINLALQDTNGAGILTKQSADLLDRRDVLLTQLSERVDITVVNEEQNVISVFIGNGQALLNGNNAFTLGTQNDPTDPTRDIITYSGLIAQGDISDQISQGELGALLRFRDGVLDPTRNRIGRLAVGLAETINAQMRDGMDLNGNLGTDFFSYQAPVVYNNLGNTGGSVTAAITDVTALTIDDYSATYNGASWPVTSTSGTSATLAAASGNLAFEGITFALDNTGAAIGDSFTIRPTLAATRSLSVVMTDPDLVAAAAPIRTDTSLNNLGDVTISPGRVTDVTNADLLTTVTIRFNDPPTDFDVVGANPAQNGVAYTNNMTVSANGWEITLSGVSPQGGDEFTIESNAGGQGDNRNMLLIGALDSTNIFDGGTATYQEDYATAIGFVARQTQAAIIDSEASEALLIQTREQRLTVSGVNLDEEAADLVRYQQAYEANARVIAVAQTIFDTLINSTR